MKSIVYASLLLLVFSCRQNTAFVNASFVDSIIINYKPSQVAVTTENDLLFWKKRVDSLPPSFVDLYKYASALAARFHIYGDINDLKKADSIVGLLGRQYPEPEYLLQKAGYLMLQHRFSEAGAYIDSVDKMKGENFATQLMRFDVNFELGNDYNAAMILKKNYVPTNYAYNFRLSKQDHRKGELDSAIVHMMKAASLAASNPYLKQAAVSNAADLYVHAGVLRKAVDLYEACILENPSDFHSMLGLGWIALVHDNNDSLAIRLFSFVKEKQRSPDAIFKLAQATEMKEPARAKQYAMAFAAEAGRSAYGNMYNKYLIQLYTGILNDPTKALEIATREIQHRATPQTYAWLCWSLLQNGQAKQAYEVFRQHVSGKSLEATELYWMGKLMKALGKGYNARQFFEAAEENRYDLSPAMYADLEEQKN